jgi:outer membrane receptor protein involved in Fe transport
VVDGSDLNCVPYNIFTLGGVTPAALAYVSTPGLQKGETVQRIQAARCRRTSATTAGASRARSRASASRSAPSVAWRSCRSRRTWRSNTGDLSGQGGPTQDLSGQFHGEGLLRRAARADPRFLSVNGSYRYSDYSTGKTTDSYGLGIELTPTKTFKVRGSYQQAVRAGNVIELFATQGLGLFNMATDPCGRDPALQPNPTATAAQCARSGLSAANYGSTLLISPAGQYKRPLRRQPGRQPGDGQDVHGRPGVDAGAQLQRDAGLLRHQGRGHHQLGGRALALVVNQCIFQGQFCSLINRDPRTGALWVQGGFVSATTLNAGSLKTSGLDISMNYNYNIGRYGGLGFSFNGTWTEKLVNEPLPGFGSYDCAGFYGATCGTPTPQWRHKFRTVWSSPWNFDLAATWRHMNSVDLDASSSDALLTAPFAPITQTLGARDYLDLALTWNVWKRVSFRIGVNNLFDRDPPTCDSTSVCGPPFGNGNAYPQVYDSLGRKFFTGLTVNF